MFGLQPMHWLIIVAVAVIIFAPSRLPEIVRSLGKTVREFRAGIREPVASSQTSSPQDPPRSDSPSQKS